MVDKKQSTDKDVRKSRMQKPAKEVKRPTQEVKVRQAVARLSKKSDGIEFFQWLMNECNFKGTTLLGDPKTGDFHPVATTLMEARRHVYLSVRRLIPAAQLDVIESNIEEKK